MYIPPLATTQHHSLSSDEESTGRKKKQLKMKKFCCDCLIELLINTKGHHSSKHSSKCQPIFAHTHTQTYKQTHTHTICQLVILVTCLPSFRISQQLENNKHSIWFIRYLNSCPPRVRRLKQTGELFEIVEYAFLHVHFKLEFMSGPTPHFPHTLSSIFHFLNAHKKEQGHIWQFPSVASQSFCFLFKTVSVLKRPSCPVSCNKTSHIWSQKFFILGKKGNKKSQVHPSFT